jgi:hypothetical protein
VVLLHPGLRRHPHIGVDGPEHRDMMIIQRMSDAFNRNSKVVRFQMSGVNEMQPFPELHNATLSWMGPNGFALTGVELTDGIA